MPTYVVTGPDGKKYRVTGNGTAEEALAQVKAKSAPEPEGTDKGMLWPVSRDQQGNLQFDSDAGIVGMAKRALTLPYDVYRGNVQMTDPATGRTSDEAIGRSMEAAGVMTPVNPAVRSGSGLIPGATQSMRKSRPPVPTNDELVKAGADGFNQMRATGATYPSSSVKKAADETMIRMNADGFDETLAPKTFAILKQLTEPPAGSYATIANLHSARRKFGKIAGNYSDPTEQAAAIQARNAVDELIGGFGDMASPPVSPASAGSGAVGRTVEARKAAAKALEEANANYAAGKRSDLIQGIDRAADLRASAANSGQNTGNTIRQRVASALLREKDTAGFSAAEKDMLEALVRGSRGANATRAAGNILGGGGGLGALVTGGFGAGAGAVLGGPVGGMAGAVIPPLAGGAMKGISNRLTQRALMNADEAIRMRSPLYQKRAADAPMEVIRNPSTEAIIRALVAGQMQAE